VLLRKAETRFRLATRDYAQLAAFRHALRGFLRFSEDAAAAVGLTTQHYQAMLVLRACPDERRVTIGDLARQLFIKHNSAVGLVDRLVDEKLVADDWKFGPNKGVVTQSVVAIVVRKGNPKGIKGWDDLVKPGVKIVTPNPGSSGSAMPFEKPMPSVYSRQ